MRNEDPPERERAVLEMVERALEVPEAERGDFLDAACGADDALRSRVAELLPLGSDLGPAPWAEWIERSGWDADGAYDSGARIGAFEIVRPIAWGGMGRVYEARQERPRRRVALKVLRRELESEEMERRFRWESELLARLDHPGIATVHAAGIHREETATGPRDVPWIALEHVAGARPIDAYADEQGLEPRARLALFLQVLDAVQHGHQRGVIHRDLKPANVLVDGSGRVKLIDFGVARALGDDSERPDDLTVQGQLVGTLRYMSPEQASGSKDDVDAQSDVYALGVVLYELVCGRHPHDVEGLSLPAVARAVAEQEPLRPRRAVTGLDRDLEAVLLRALEKEKGRRYASAAALADDVRALLAGRAVTARQPTLGRQLVLFARRSPVVVGSVALVFLVLVGATVVSLRFGLREAAARRESEELQQGLLHQTFALHFDFAPRLAELQGSLDVRRSMIREAIDKLELLEGRAGGDPALRHRLGLAYRSLGDVLGNPLRDNLGDVEGARGCYARSLALFEALGTDEADVEATYSRLALAQLDLFAGRPEQALPYYEEFLAMARENEGAAWATDRLLKDQAAALLEAGSALGILGQHDRALALFELAASLRDELLARQSEDPDREVAAAIALSKVATARFVLGESGASGTLLEALSRIESVVAAFPRLPRHHRTLAETAALASDILIRESEHDAAQRTLDLGLQENEALSKGDPESAFYRRQRGLLTYNQAWLLRDRGRLARADGSEEWRAALETCLEWLARSRDVWGEMREREELQPREEGYLARIDREIDELEQELLRE